VRISPSILFYSLRKAKKNVWLAILPC